MALRAMLAQTFIAHVYCEPCSVHRIKFGTSVMTRSRKFERKIWLVLAGIAVLQFVLANDAWYGLIALH